ncbi:hypothetical protein BpJC7_22710 [Weizmannia acidilactici]|uniref:Uncharacterized protein n=1 Tax=Weizmannia acidilactici TaxID=2607726 RepID=A0A5J4JK89_9BACI|nr:hypothetical protein [Weizmannia acidilactici]GER68297.1 hypothetical protein BpJC4_27680 [Weizmannia acidilactici]GER70968.1 hypothetical protein BpJC7_22710 [Weizmannia acidilactici]GER74587.1 hypothetical protein BpPP18_26540 [Weizmannia acidilactici]
MSWLIGIIIIIVLVHFLIIKPLTQRNRPQVYEPGRNMYNGDEDRPEMGGWSGMEGTGMGRFGTFAGGLATGALLTYLLEQGRIGFDQFQYLQYLDDHELLRELEDQNILQLDEIDQLQDELSRRFGDSSENDWNQDNGESNYDQADTNPNEQQDDNDFGGWDNGSDGSWI